MVSLLWCYICVRPNPRGMRYGSVADEEADEGAEDNTQQLWLHVGAGTLLVSLVGSLMHFIYKWSNCNPFVGVFCAVNESTWEHAKIMLVPLLLWWFVLTGDAVACCWASYSALAFLLIFNGLSLLGGFESLPYDIVIFVLSILFGQYMGALALQSCDWRGGLLSLAPLLVLLAFCTYIAPRWPYMFMDHARGIYGPPVNCTL